jgi:RND family efflux transporter MFP subunit
VISDPLKLRSRIPERYAADVQLGHTVVLEPLDSVRALEGAITRNSPVVDPTTRTFEIEALIPNDADAIKPGAFARGTIDTVAGRAVVSVPSRAIVRSGGMTRLFIYADGVARQRNVQLGRQADGLVEALSGVQEGEQVITEGAAALIDGTPVAIGPPSS